MEQAPHHLEKMQNNRKIAPQLLEFTIAESESPVDNVSVKRGLQIVHQHFIAPDFNLVHFVRNKGQDFLIRIGIIKFELIEAFGDI